ncbi:MAG: class I SAM-dependent rRNA methyltransferase [Pseudomonadota bacterium]
MTPSSLPVVRLKPKANARAIRHGAPWVYDNEVVTDRRTRKIAPGMICLLEDADRTPLALVGINPGSKIFARVLERDLTAQIDRTWLLSKLQAALALREKLYDTPFYRLIHAEGDSLPGVVIDRFGAYAVVQPNAAWAEVLLPDLVDALQEVTGVTHVLKNASGRARVLEGLDQDSGVLAGQAPAAPVEVAMNGAVYLADLVEGQKTGIFYDQRPNHAFAAGVARGARVLDVFSHVGGFGLAALAAGAESVLAVDGSAPALALASEGAARMGQSDRFATRQGDAFETLTALADEDAQFDLVICDPPAFAPNKQALEAGLRAYERIARLSARLVADGGILCLCSCSHAADLARFRGASVRGIGRAGGQGALIHTGFAGPDHPQHPQLAETAYLKALFFRL